MMRGVWRACVLAAMLVAGQSVWGAEKKLNVVWIVADDLGYADAGCYGCKDIPTPAIDGLAKEGVRMTSAYAYPTCSPTRAALLTGRYAERYGVSGALMGDNPPNFGKAVTIAEVLKENGYVTGAVGKWHLGYTGNVTPLHKGFESFYGFRGGKIDYFKHTDTAQKNGTPEGKHDFYDNDTEIFPTGFSTDLFTARACEFLEKQKEKPFFLYLAYNAPHYAKVGVWEAPEEYLKKFHAEGQVKGRGVYAACVASMDDGIGKVLAQIHTLGLDENTLVVFSNDNGGEVWASNAPFRGGKHQYTEGGVRVGQIWRLPGVLKAGSVSDEAVHVVDLMPTVLDCVGVTKPAGVEFDGEDVWQSLVKGEKVPERGLYLGDDALREGQWKLLDGKLFDLAADVRETHDLSGDNKDVKDRMEKELKDWQKKLKE